MLIGATGCASNAASSAYPSGRQGCTMTSFGGHCGARWRAVVSHETALAVFISVTPILPPSISPSPKTSAPEPQG